MCSLGEGASGGRPPPIHVRRRRDAARDLRRCRVAHVHHRQVGDVAVAGVGAFMLFRKPRIEYFDDIWCNDGCQNIETEFGGIQAYIQHMEACCSLGDLLDHLCN